jgi:uncharacterized Zn-binding protein involved in type VI secretion
MPPAAKITDMHTCPMQTPDFPASLPHVGGPVIGPGARMGDATAHGGSIVLGCPTVMIGG